MMSPVRQRVETPSAVVTVEPLVEPRSTTNSPPASIPMARCDLETVRVSSATLINCASSSPGWGCGLRPSSTRPSMLISRPSSSTAIHAGDAGDPDGEAAGADTWVWSVGEEPDTGPGVGADSGSTAGGG